MPERDSDETYKPQPMSIPEKYQTFLVDEIGLPPDFDYQLREEQKPMFYTKFVSSDCRTAKAVQAKRLAETGEYERYINTDNHKFREDYDPRILGKEDFRLRIGKTSVPKLIMEGPTYRQLEDARLMNQRHEEKEALERH